MSLREWQAALVDLVAGHDPTAPGLTAAEREWLTGVRGTPGLEITAQVRSWCGASGSRAVPR